MTIPIPQKTSGNKLKDFYPLQKEELIKLREVKLINNTAYVHLALRSENPFCDRSIQIVPREFAQRWKIPESSLYKAIAKLKKLLVVSIESGKLLIDWVKSKTYKTESSSDKVVQTEDSQSEQNILRSEHKLSDVRIDYQIRENQERKLLFDMESSFSQTLKSIQTNQIQEGEEESNSKEESDLLRAEISSNKELRPESAAKDKRNSCLSCSDESVRQATSNVAYKKGKRLSDFKSKKYDQIPSDLIAKLEELEIPLDGKVKSAIASHDISQAYGAAVHVQNTWDSITNHRSVFLYQLSKQPIEKLGSRYSEEIISNIKARNRAIEEERNNPEYFSKSKEVFAQIRAKLLPNKDALAHLPNQMLS